MNILSIFFFHYYNTGVSLQNSTIAKSDFNGTDIVLSKLSRTSSASPTGTPSNKTLTVVSASPSINASVSVAWCRPFHSDNRHVCLIIWPGSSSKTHPSHCHQIARSEYRQLEYRLQKHRKEVCKQDWIVTKQKLGPCQ